MYYNIKHPIPIPNHWKKDIHSPALVPCSSIKTGNTRKIGRKPITGPVSRRVILFICCLSLLLLLPLKAHAKNQFPKPKGLLNDFAEVIEPEYKQKILAIITEVLQKTHVPIVVVTMPSIDGEDYNEYANRLYEAWGIGQKGVDKGVLIFLTIKERKMRIEVGYGLEGILPDGLVGEIRDRYMLPYLKKNRFGQGILNGVIAVSNIIARDAGVSLTGKPMVRKPARNKKGLSVLSIFMILAIFFLISGRRGRGSWLILPFLLGGGSNEHTTYTGGGFTGGFGSFGGFGGGMSGGGGAGGGF